MDEMDTVARREDPAKPTSGLDAKRDADMSRVSAKARDNPWQRAMKNSPRGEGLRDNNLREAALRIVKEIRARRNPRYHWTVQSSKAALLTSRKLLLPLARPRRFGHVTDPAAAPSGGT